VSDKTKRARLRPLWTLLLVLVPAVRVDAQNALKTMNNPGGGTIVYGPVDGAASEAAAMGVILHSLHQRYGDKPQVGKVFRVRGSKSAAVFFTLARHDQGDMHIAGLLIASQSRPGRVEAALLSDDAKRFGTTINPMLQVLNRSWHPDASAGDSAAAIAPAQTLRPYTLPDHSASVSLPAAWKVNPTSGGGTIFADGPNGESAALDLPMLAMNSNDPRVRQTMRFAQGAGRNTVYARALYYPYGGDPGRTFVDLLGMMRRMKGMPEMRMQIDNETRLQGGSRASCTRLRGHADPQDGKGVREFNTLFCSGPLSPMGQYMNIAFHTGVPAALATHERATMDAILESFQVNMAIVNQEAARIAAPAIEQIHAIGRAAAAQAAQAHRLEDAHNQGVEQRWDRQDEHNQAFSNYLLDQTVISDNQTNAHATVWNTTADALVKGNPSRFGYVDTPDFWKGVDY
jgi:hypothetical protein